MSPGAAIPAIPLIHRSLPSHCTYPCPANPFHCPPSCTSPTQALKQRGIDTALTNSKLASDFASTSPNLHVPKLKLNLAGRNINGTKKDPAPPAPEEVAPPPKNLVEKLDRFLLLDMDSGDGVRVPEPRPFFGPSAATPELAAARTYPPSFLSIVDPSPSSFMPEMGQGQGQGTATGAGTSGSAAAGPASPGRDGRVRYQPYERQQRPPHLTLVFPLDLSPLLPPEVDAAVLREPGAWEQHESLAAAAAMATAAGAAAGAGTGTGTGTGAGAGVVTDRAGSTGSVGGAGGLGTGQAAEAASDTAAGLPAQAGITPPAAATKRKVKIVDAETES